jgi:hypothetical protein
MYPSCLRPAWLLVQAAPRFRGAMTGELPMSGPQKKADHRKGNTRGLIGPIDRRVHGEHVEV